MLAVLLASVLASTSLTALTVLAGPATPAAAARPPATLAIALLAPTVLTEGSTLRVGGRVTNTGRHGLRDVEVRLRLSATRLGSRAELAGVVKGEITSRDGEVVVSSNLPDLGRGEEADFTLAKSTDELVALAGFGVHVVGVEVLASRREGFGRVALERLVVPWVPADEEVIPTGYTWLWPLVARPSRLADGTFADDELAAEIAPGGRLARLVEAGVRLGQDGGLTWAIDPELVSAVTDMADAEGYEVRGSDGPVPGSAGSLAVRWLESLRIATNGVPVLALPYGDIDVTAVVRAGLGADLTRAMSTGRTALINALPAADITTTVGWPANGFTSRRSLAALRSADVTSVVLDGRAVPPEVDLSYTPTGRATVATPTGGIAALLAEPGLADRLASRVRDPLMAAHRLTAETAMIASELPSGPARSVLLMPPRRYDPDPAFLERVASTLEQASWLQPISLAGLAATPPPEIDRQPLRYPRQQRAAELPRSYLRAIHAMHESVAVFADVLSDPSVYIPRLERAILLVESHWWRGRNARANRLARERGDLAELRGLVRVQPGNFTFSSRRGTLALTVANGLDQEVEVSLYLRPQTTRLRLETVEPAVIGPRSKEQIQVSAVAVAPGPVVVDATLRTPSGAAYDQPVQLRIRITEYGTVAVYITLAAGGVLFLAAGLRVLRRLAGARAP